ncbi:checkpoint protein Hus1/Mec3, partial [Mycena sp. CBHHK59/15]
ITVFLSSEALKSASANTNASSSYETEEIVMKLVKKNDQAVLMFEIAGMTRQERRVRVAHDVRVDVMKPMDVARLNKLMCPEPNTHIILPPLRKLRTIVDHLCPMSYILAVRANNSGRLQLSIRTDSFDVQTEWTDCKNTTRAATASQEAPDPRDPTELFTMLVSTRSFLKFLNSHVVSTTTIACTCQNYCMILYVYVGDFTDAGGVLTFYTPAIIDN